MAGGVASSENTRDHHQRMLITKSNELKSTVNKLLTLFESEDTEEVESTKVEGCVFKATKITSHLRREVSHYRVPNETIQSGQYWDRQ